MVFLCRKILQIFSRTAFASLLLTATYLPSQAEDKAIVSNHAIVELYTSQGCSSCPPADALMGELAKQKNVTALTLPVDYWDYLGWKDTLARREYSIRQREYALNRGDRQVYTPQMVVNGISHVVGNNRYRVSHAVKRAQKRFADNAIPLHLSKDGMSLWIKTGKLDQNIRKKTGAIWLACVKKAVTVNIGRGENTGRTITYYNVVRQLSPVGQWMGKDVNVQLPLKAFQQHKPDFFVAMIQDRENGEIIGVAKLTNK